MTYAAAIRRIAFIIRCSGSAAIAYLLANYVGLMHPVWAPMSALIVSQERLKDTRTSFHSRIVGTIMGLAVAVAVHTLLAPWHLDTALEVALTVAACAWPAHRRPALRVSMWTGPIVLLTSAPGVSAAGIALIRGGEVILGSLVGAVMHLLMDQVLLEFFVPRPKNPVAKVSGGPRHSRT